MQRPSKLKLVFLSAVLMGSSLATAAFGHDLVVIQNGEMVGRVAIERTESRVIIDYGVVQNARGPELQSVIELGPGGFPLVWTIDGTSLMGGRVKERFQQDDQQAMWSSQADRGRVEIDGHMLYVSNDSTPWDLGLYARVLLQAEGQALDVLPTGQMSLTALKCMTLEDKSAQVKLTAYRLEGIGLEADYLILDQNHGLVAHHRGRGSLTIREDLVDVQATIGQKLRSLRRADIARIQQSLVHRHDGPIHVRNVRLFDPDTGRFSPPSTVVVEDGRIVEVGLNGSPAADHALIVEGDNGYLVPGLHDMHAHTSLMSGMYYLAAGVTSTRDMGNYNDWLLDYLEQKHTGQLIGPHVYRAGFIEGRSEFSARTGIIADDLDQALRAVDWYADHGYEQIKLYNSIPGEWIRPVIDRAGEHGLRISGHVPAFVHPDQAIEWGYSDIAHINQLVLGWLLDEGEDSRTTIRLTAMKRTRDLDLDSAPVRKTLGLMREHGVAIDTTAVILERLMKSRAGTTPPGDLDYLDHAPIGYQRHRKRTFVPLADKAEDQQYLESADALLGVLKLLHDSGIALLPGTDDATGFTVHRELELYSQAGIPNAEVLRLATLDAARYLGRADNTGSIEPGKLADFFLIADNPLDDIRAIKRVRLVVKNGELYVPEEIYRALGFVPFAAPPELRRP